METLEQMRATHRETARYGVYIASRKLRVVLYTGLKYDMAIEVSNQLQAEWIDSLPSKTACFTTPVHGIVLENPAECLSPEALARMRLDNPGRWVKKNE